MSGGHSRLSPSGAHRWIQCPPSAKLQEQYPEQESEFAAEGTEAHRLGEWKVRRMLGEDPPDPRPEMRYADAEMEEATDLYASRVKEVLAEARGLCGDPRVLTEQQVDFSRWAPEAFGTTDTLIAGTGCLWILDLKYGKGIRVEAEDNEQLCCYALGGLELLDDLYDLREIRMQIIQPRIGNISEWVISRENLLTWAENILQPAAALAAAGKGDFRPGEHCRFCRARHDCRARAEQQIRLMRYDFDTPATLTEAEMTDILGQADQLIAWAEDIKSYALKKALEGKQWKGFRLTAGRAERRFTDEAAVAKAVLAEGKDPYEKKLLGITAMTKLLGRKRFQELLGKHVEKSRGAPKLVPEEKAGRPEADFSDLREENEAKEENQKKEKQKP